jgi:hypothetical protein
LPFKRIGRALAIACVVIATWTLALIATSAYTHDRNLADGTSAQPAVVPPAPWPVRPSASALFSRTQAAATAPRALSAADRAHQSAPAPAAQPPGTLSSPRPLAAPSSPTAIMPDGVPAAEVGSLVQSDSAADLWNTWAHNTLTGSDCDNPGTVTLTAAQLDLTTSGVMGNCAEITSNATYGYGIYEARIWVQAGPGGVIANWPAFWLVGADWPVDGEIDAFEGLGGYDSATFHYGADNSQLSQQDKALKPGWNIVDVVWKPQFLAVYYNGAEFVQWDSAVITSQPMRIIFDATTGQAGYTTGQPSTMDIDYLRSWRIA